MLCVSITGVEVGKPTHFTIYTKGAGKATPEVNFTAAGKGEAVSDFEIIDNHDYSFTVRYTALQQVRHSSSGLRFIKMDTMWSHAIINLLWYYKTSCSALFCFVI